MDPANFSHVDIIFKLANQVDPNFSATFQYPHEITKELAEKALKTLREDQFNYALPFHRIEALEKALLTIKKAKFEDLKLKKAWQCFSCCTMRKEKAPHLEKTLEETLNVIVHNRHFRNFAQRILLKPENLPSSVELLEKYFEFDVRHHLPYNGTFPALKKPNGVVIEKLILNFQDNDPLYLFFKELLKKNTAQYPWHQGALFRLGHLLEQISSSAWEEIIFRPLRSSLSLDSGALSQEIDFLFFTHVMEKRVDKLFHLEENIALSLSLLKENIFKACVFEGDTLRSYKKQFHAENYFRAILGKEVGLQENLSCLDPNIFPSLEKEPNILEEKKVKELIKKKFFENYKVKTALQHIQKKLSSKIEKNELNFEIIFEALEMCGWEAEDYEKIMEGDNLSIRATIALLCLAGVLHTDYWKDSPWLNKP